MNLIKDKFPLVCSLSKENDFVCPGANSVGGCSIYTNDGVLAKARQGKCGFKELRRPVTEAKGKFVNPLKASKKKAKKGSVA